MTNKQKSEVISMRKKGHSYAEIADWLGLKKNTISAFCRRTGIIADSNDVPVQEKDNHDICENCGAILIHTPKHKKKRFCSDKCRVKWWNQHKDSVNRKAVYHFKCAKCGIDFTAYGNSKRKYCSHKCYISARYNGGAVCE